MTQLGNHEIYRGRSLAGDKIFRLRQRCLECSQLVDECAQANIAAEFIALIDDYVDRRYRVARPG